jgi:hypothetical protein
MNCPCNKNEMTLRDFRRWLNDNPEARMHAASVCKSDALGAPVELVEVDGKPVLRVGISQREEPERAPWWRRVPWMKRSE